MPISLLTNLAAMAAGRNLNEANAEFTKSVARLSSGRQAATAGEDPSGTARAALMEAEMRSQGAAQRNIEDLRSALQVAEGGMNEINNALMRMREVTVLAASSWPGEQEREILNREIISLREEMDRISQTTRWGNLKFLNGEGKLVMLQMGAGAGDIDRVQFELSWDVSGSALGTDSVDISDADNALDSLSTIDNALNKIHLARAEAGAMQNRMNISTNHLQMMSDQLKADIARIREVDYAKEVVRALSKDIQQRTAAAVLVQANAHPTSILKLLEW